VKTLLTIAVFLYAAYEARAQSGGVEQYYYTRTKGTDAMMTPIAHITSSNNWYGEARYNFDELNTFSLYAGRKFAGSGNLNWEATPIVGGLMGQMNGGSLGMNVGFDYKRLFFLSQSQYSFSMENGTDKFFYNWSELGFEATQWLYAGVAVQQTNIYQEKGRMEPGCMIGFSIKNWTIPLYAFNTSDQDRYFVLGVNWQWEGRKKKTRNEQVITSETNTNKFE
jgi:hypothetical protein